MTANSPGVVGGIVTGAVTLVTLAVAFGGLAVGWSAFWIAFPVGFGGVLPVALALSAWYYSDDSAGKSDTTTDAEAALHALREQYATGEIDELAFERRLERLLETESIADAEQVSPNSRKERAPTGRIDDRTPERPASERPVHERPASERPASERPDRERTDRERTDRERPDRDRA